MYNFFNFDDEVPPEIAKEMAAVGIIPCEDHIPTNTILTLAGQRFKVLGPATKEEFLAAVEASGLCGEIFQQPPEFMHFIKVSTD